jgi:hypothetical protein
MNRKILSILVLAIVLSVSLVKATTSEIRSPLSVLRGPFHYPLGPVDRDIWSYNIDKTEEEEENLWIIESWSTGYERKADKAYIDCCSTSSNCCSNICYSSCLTTSYYCCPQSKNTTNTVPLSTLFFGKADFRGEEAFINGIMPASCTNNPALIFSKLYPRFDYNEHGVVLGLHAQRRFDAESHWHCGGRISLPVKVIEIEQRRSCGSERFEEGYGDVIVEYQQRVDEEPLTGNVIAYRLDFLSSLCWIDGTPLVNYGDGTKDTTIAIVPITKYLTRTIQVPHVGSDAPVSALRITSEKLPNPAALPDPTGVYPLAKKVESATILAADGLGGANYERLVFNTTNNYADGLGNDRDAQRKLFIVPNTKTVGGGVIEPDALLIQNKIQYLLNQLALTDGNSAEQFFKDHCICFCLSDYIAGVGDLDTEIYVGYEGAHGYLDGIFGVRFPTGKKPDDARRIYYQALGNKGHFEIKAALEGGWDPCDFFAVRCYFSYSYVIGATECRAPAFRGATIRNIPVGPAIQADVKWDYFLGNIDLGWYHPNNPNLGFTLGYECYAKRNDRVRLTPMAKDFFDNTAQLDNCILECNTNTMTHKIRSEIFNRIGYCEFFGGGSWIFAGRNALKETELHIGVAIYF